MKTITDFANEHNIRMDEPERVSQRPDGNMGDLPRHWRCVLRCGKKRMTVYFSQGSAHTEPPKFNDVFDALAMDSHSYLEHASAREFKSEYGYETLIQATKVYNACKRTYERLQTLIGDEALQSLLYETERE